MLQSKIFRPMLRPLLPPILLSTAGLIYTVRALIHTELTPGRIGCLFQILIWICLITVLCSEKLRSKLLLRWIGPREQIGCFLCWGAVVMILWSWVQPPILITGSLRFAPVFALLCLVAGFYALMSDGRVVRLCMLATILLLCYELIFTLSACGLGYDWEGNRLRIIGEGMFLPVIYALTAPMERGCSAEILSRALEPFLRRDCTVSGERRTAFRRIHLLLTAVAALWLIGGHLREILQWDFSFWPQLLLTGLIVLILLTGSLPDLPPFCSFLVAIPVVFKLILDLEQDSFLSASDYAAVYLTADGLLVFCVLLGYQTAFNLTAATEAIVLLIEFAGCFALEEGRADVLLGSAPLLYGAEILLALSLLCFGYGEPWIGRSGFTSWMESFLGVEFEEDDQTEYLDDPERGGAS